MSIRRLSRGGWAMVLWATLLGMLAFPALASAPEVSSGVAVLAPVGATRVSVEGFLSPAAEGHPGTYEFLYNKASAGECENGGHAPEAPGIMLGFEDERVAETLTGLEPSTEYVVCLLARNPKGEETVSNPAVKFTTAAALETPETVKPATGVTKSSATLHGVLNPGAEAEAGERYEFLYKASTTAECEGGEPLGSEEAGGAVKEAVHAEVGGLAPSTEYAFCLRAINAAGETLTGNPVTFTTEGQEPAIEGETFSKVGPHDASVTAQVNMENQEGDYYYLYGTTGEFEAGKARKTAEVGLRASGVPVAAAARLGGLPAGGEYHFRLVVTNADDQVALGEVLTFHTLTEGALVLPDNRAYEMVTPVENDNADVYIPRETTNQVTRGGTSTQRPFEVSPEGNTVTYLADPTSGGVGNSGNGAGNEYTARHLPEGGWLQSNIQPSSRNATVYEGFTNDLTTGFLYSSSEGSPLLPPLSLGAPGSGYEVLYKCGISVGPCTTPEESEVTPQNPFQALFGTPPNRSAGQFGARLVITDGHGGTVPVFAGSSTLGDVLFEANDALLKGNGSVELALQKSVEEEIAKGEDGNYLYESNNGSLSLVDILPNGAVASNATFGATYIPGNNNNPPDFSNVISTDGSRVFWTDLAGDGGSGLGIIYVRVDRLSTAQVSPGAARYWTSAADGRYAFYTESLVAGGSEGLYRYNTNSRKRETLADPAADVLGVIGTSEDGESIYFVAKGVLGSKPSGEGELPVKGEPNLYLLHPGSEPVFIAPLSAQDNNEMPPFYSSVNSGKAEYGDWQPALANRTAGVSANGDGVTFMSGQPLAVVGYPEGYPVRGGYEVYMFDAGANRLFCVSCSPSGESPPSSANGADGFLPISWNDTYEMRWISEDGSRVFFDSAVPLVAQDTNGTMDVYEWEREGSEGCKTGAGVNGGCDYLLSGGTSQAESWLIGASASGNDVFINTRAQLVPEDQNGAFDLYDARVGGVQPVSPPVCTGGGCQGVPAPPPMFATPPSGTFSGVGNFPAVIESPALTRAQKLANALKACRKEAKRRRTGCEVQARKRYGPVVKKKEKRVVKGKDGRRAGKERK